MKRTTVVLSDQVAAVLEFERRKRGISTAALIREAVEHYLFDQPKTLSFIGIAPPLEERDLAAEAKRIMADPWARFILEDSGLTLPTDPAEGDGDDGDRSSVVAAPEPAHQV